MKAMTFHIPEELKQRLEARKIESGLGIAAMVRKAIEQYLNRCAR
jgi:predicted DNA-binding protein